MGLILSSCVVNTNNANLLYTTWDSLEPDAWAAIWLIKRHIDPDAEILLRPVGAPIDNAIAFGVPGAKYQRSHDRSLYDSLMEGLPVDDPALHELGRIIHDIEISPWATQTSIYTAVVEQSFRRLQDTFEARNVPVDCYGRYFDIVYELLSGNQPVGEWGRLDDLTLAEPACHVGSSTLARRDKSPFVQRFATDVVLGHIAADKKVIFVDVREPLEYAEFHIPGAVNVQLRDLTPDIMDRFRGADFVIPYCIKDFRGFEMARSLAERGLQNVGIMQPYGIAGWRRMGLPLAAPEGLSDPEAQAELMACSKAGTCLKTKS